MVTTISKTIAKTKEQYDVNSLPVVIVAQWATRLVSSSLFTLFILSEVGQDMLLVVTWAIDGIYHSDCNGIYRFSKKCENIFDFITRLGIIFVNC